MKCTQCNNTSFIENVNFPYEALEGGKVAKGFATYVCDECGHVEQFYHSIVEMKNEIREFTKEHEKQVEELEKIVEEYENSIEAINQKISLVKKKELERIESIISDKTNTVLTNEKAKAELKVIKNLDRRGELELIGMTVEDYPDRRKSKNAERKIRDAKEYYEIRKSQIRKKYE